MLRLIACFSPFTPPIDLKTIKHFRMYSSYDYRPHMGIGIASYVSSCPQLGLMRLLDFFVTARSIPCLGGCTCISIGALIQHMDTRATGVTSDEI